jgi:hypothetical protein
MPRLISSIYMFTGFIISVVSALKFMPLLMRHPVFWTKHLRTGYSVEGKVSAGRMMHERTVAAIALLNHCIYLYLPNC